jgi:hypothetical protein
MQFGVTVTVYCENHTERTGTVRNSAPQPNRLMLSGKTVAVYCETYATNSYSPYLTGNTLRLRYVAQPVNAVWENRRCSMCGQNVQGGPDSVRYFPIFPFVVGLIGY